MPARQRIINRAGSRITLTEPSEAEMLSQLSFIWDGGGELNKGCYSVT